METTPAVMTEQGKKARRREYQRQWAANKRAGKAGNKVLSFPPQPEAQITAEPALKKKKMPKSCSKVSELQLTVDRLAAELRSTIDLLKVSEERRQSEATKLQSIVRERPRGWAFESPEKPAHIAFLAPFPPKTKGKDEKMGAGTVDNRSTGTLSDISWLSFLFVLTCITGFTALTVYLQHLIYIDRGYSDLLSWAFSGVGELALLTTAYFIRFAHGIRKFYLSAALVTGGLIVACTVGNGAFEKVQYERGQKARAERDYLLAVKSVEDYNKSQAKKWNEKKIRLIKNRDDIQKTRDEYKEKQYSKADRQKQDDNLDKARTAIEVHDKTAPDLKDIPKTAILASPNILSLWLQVGFQLFIFAISIGLAGLLPSLIHREKNK